MKPMNKYIALSYLLLGSLTATQNLFGMDDRLMDQFDVISSSSSLSYPNSPHFSEVSLDEDIYPDINQLMAEVTLQPAGSKEQYQIFLYSLFEYNKRYRAVEPALRRTFNGTENADNMQDLLKTTAEELYYQSTPFFPTDFVSPVLSQDFLQKVPTLASAMNELIAKRNAITRSNAASQDFDNLNDQIKNCRTLHAEIKNTLETFPEGCKFSRDMRKRLAWIEKDIDGWQTFVINNGNRV